jgi:hypothetical protein
MLDVATGIVLEQKLSPPGAAPPSLPVASGGLATPATRQVQTYSSTPDCMIVENGIVWAGWTEPAELKNAAGQSFTYPNIDLASGDTLNLTSRACTE